MQRCEATVRLSGDLGNTVRKTGVSPAEIAILRFVHGGDDCVVDIKPILMDKVSHAQERARLAYIYGPEIVEKLFPGQFSQLPVSLKDIEPGAAPDPSDDGSEDEGEAKADVLPPEGVAEKMVAAAEADDELTPDDKALIAMIQEAKSKSELLAIAEENEVERTSLPDKVPDIKVHLIRSLFPMYQT